jgi:hypothetical protein
MLQSGVLTTQLDRMLACPEGGEPFPIDSCNVPEISIRFGLTMLVCASETGWIIRAD